MNATLINGKLILEYLIKSLHEINIKHATDLKGNKDNSSQHIYIINYYPYQTQENYYFFFTMNLARLDWPFTWIDLFL